LIIAFQDAFINNTSSYYIVIHSFQRLAIKTILYCQSH
jgi:hypothetical protein